MDDKEALGLSLLLVGPRAIDEEVAELESRARLDDMGSEIVFEEEALDVVEGPEEELLASSREEELSDKADGLGRSVAPIESAVDVIIDADDGGSGCSEPSPASSRRAPGLRGSPSMALSTCPCWSPAAVAAAGCCTTASKPSSMPMSASCPDGTERGIIDGLSMPFFAIQGALDFVMDALCMLLAGPRCCCFCFPASSAILPYLLVALFLYVEGTVQDVPIFPYLRPTSDGLDRVHRELKGSAPAVVLVLTDARVGPGLSGVQGVTAARKSDQARQCRRTTAYGKANGKNPTECTNGQE